MHPTTNAVTPARRATTQQVCERYQVSSRTLQGWRDRGIIPYIRINARVVRYDWDEVENAFKTSARAV